MSGGQESTQAYLRGGGEQRSLAPKFLRNSLYLESPALSVIILFCQVITYFAHLHLRTGIIVAWVLYIFIPRNNPVYPLVAPPLPPNSKYQSEPISPRDTPRRSPPVPHSQDPRPRVFQHILCCRHPSSGTWANPTHRALPIRKLGQAPFDTLTHHPTLHPTPPASSSFHHGPSRNG